MWDANKDPYSTLDGYLKLWSAKAHPVILLCGWQVTREATEAALKEARYHALSGIGNSPLSMDPLVIYLLAIKERDKKLSESDRGRFYPVVLWPDNPN